MAYNIQPITGGNELGFTSNSTPEVLFAAETNEKTSCWFTLYVVARKISNGATKIWQIFGSYKRTTGNLTISVQSLSLLGTSGDLIEMALASVSVDNDGSKFRVTISGLLSNDVQWYGTLTGEEMVEV